MRVAVAAFLERRLSFERIHAVNLQTLETVQPDAVASVEDLMELDARSREQAERVAAQWQR